MASEPKGFNDVSMIFGRNRNYFTNTLETVTWNSQSLLAGRQLASWSSLTSSLFSLTSCCQIAGSQAYLIPEEPRAQVEMFPDNPLLSSQALSFPLKKRGQKGRSCEGCLVQTTPFFFNSNLAVTAVSPTDQLPLANLFYFCLSLCGTATVSYREQEQALMLKNEIFMTGTVT